MLFPWSASSESGSRPEPRLRFFSLKPDCIMQPPLRLIWLLPILRIHLVMLTCLADTILNPVNTADNTTYTFSEKGIAWPGEKKKYSATTQYTLSDIVPPPNWALRYPNGYTESNFPDLTQDEHFQNWMRTAGLPTFSKLYGRNDNDDLKAGTYTLDVYMSAYHRSMQAFDSLTVVAVDFPVQQFGGTKSVVISTVSWIGGKNPFLGWAYIASAALFVLLAVIGLIWHCIKPRSVHLPLLLLRTAHQHAYLQQTRRYEPALMEPGTTMTDSSEHRCRLCVWLCDWGAFTFQVNFWHWRYLPSTSSSSLHYLFTPRILVCISVPNVMMNRKLILDYDECTWRACPSGRCGTYEQIPEHKTRTWTIPAAKFCNRSDPSGRTATGGNEQVLGRVRRA